MAKQQIVLSEKYLLSALDRIAKKSDGYAVLYIMASKLKPKHRHPKFLKILEKFFDGVVGLSKGVFFPLCNGDFAILGRDFTQSKNYSEETASLIDAEIKQIIDTAYNRCIQILSDNVDKLHKVAAVLLEKEKIDSEEFEAIFSE